MADPGFSPGGARTPKIAIVFQIFAENCMKIKEFGPRVGGASLAPPLDPPMNYEGDWCVETKHWRLMPSFCNCGLNKGAILMEMGGCEKHVFYIPTASSLGVVIRWRHFNVSLEWKQQILQEYTA